MPADVTPAAPAVSPTPTPPSPTPPGDEMDSTFRLLFEAAESEKTPQKDAPATNEGSGGKSLMQAIETPDAPPTDEEKAKAEKEKADKEAADKAAKETTDDKPKVKVKTKRKAEPAPTPAPAPTPEPAKVPDAKKEPTESEKFEEQLLDEEREQLSLARYAEQKDPTKYKGYAAKVTKFLKEHSAYLDAHPKATEAGSDEAEEYKAWLAKNNPALPPREVMKLEVARGIEAEKVKSDQETDVKLKRISDETFRRTKAPEIKKEADQFFDVVAREAMPEELAKAVREQGGDKAKALFPLEYRVAGEVLQQVTSDMEEFRLMTTTNDDTGTPLKAYDESNPQHARIVKFVVEQCERFKNGGPGETPEARATRIKLNTRADGKKYLTRTEYFSLKKEQRDPYWTFSPDQIVAIYRYGTKYEIDKQIARERKIREDDGYIRKPAAAAPAAMPASTPSESSPPAPRPSQIPSGGGGGDGEQKSERALSILMGE